MDWSNIADYCTIAFFLWYGLMNFVSALKSDLSIKLGSVLALLAAVTTYLAI
jgi:hypothetical protein